MQHQREALVKGSEEAVAVHLEAVLVAHGRAPQASVVGNVLDRAARPLALQTGQIADADVALTELDTIEPVVV